MNDTEEKEALKIRYSQRLPWQAPQNSFSFLLSQHERNGHKLLDLSGANPTIALADYPHSAIAEALAADDSFVYQPHPFGHYPARVVIGQRTGVPPECVALTASTSEAYSVLFKLLCDPGDEVLTPSPSYPLFEHLAQADCVHLRSYRLVYDGCWHIDFESLVRALTPRTRAIVVVNPNNPTGSFLSIAEYQRLVVLAASRAVPLISDEVFADYGFQACATRIGTLTGREDVLTFSLNGLSKASGMPQMKLGWIAVNGPAGERRRACARLEMLLDNYLSVSLLVQLAVLPLLAVGDGIRHQIRTRIQFNIANLDRLLEGTTIHRLHAEGGWSAILRLANVLSEEDCITRLLLEHSVIVQPGYFFDMPGSGTYLVVSLLTDPDVLAEGISRLVRLIQS